MSSYISIPSRLKQVDPKKQDDNYTLIDTSKRSLVVRFTRGYICLYIRFASDYLKSTINTDSFEAQRNHSRIGANCDLFAFEWSRDDARSCAQLSANISLVIRQALSDKLIGCGIIAFLKSLTFSPDTLRILSDTQSTHPTNSLH